jgi:hypothetical protein
MMLFLQHRALFDVDFDITEQFLRIEPARIQARRVAAETPNGIGHCDAAGIDASQIVRVESAGHSAAAEKGGLVSDAFLVCECQDFNGKREVAAPHLFQAGNRQNDAQRAIKPAGISHGIEMGAKQKSFRAGSRGRKPANQIAYGIMSHRQSGLRHPRGHKIIGAAHGRRGKGPRQSTGLLADAAEGFKARDCLCDIIHR